MTLGLGQKAQQAIERHIFLPVLLMWIWPRASVRELMSRDSPVAVLALAGLGGVLLTLLLVTFRAPGIRLLFHPAVLLVIGVVVGIGGLYLGGWLAALLGRLLGVQATMAELRRALSWTTLPAISVMIMIAGIWLWRGWGKSFNSPIDVSSDEGQVAGWVVLLTPLGLWGLIVLVLATAEAFRVALPKALALVGLFGGSIFGASVTVADFLHIQVPSLALGIDGMFPDAGIRSERLLVRPPEPLSRGDVIAIKHIRVQDRRFGEQTYYELTRVIGLPGDIVGMTDGVLSLNGQAIPRRPWLNHRGRYLETLPGGVSYFANYYDPAPTLPGMRVGPDEVYVLGDNRAYGYAMRADGTLIPPRNLASTRLIARDRVAGKVVVPPLPESVARLGR